MQPKPLRFGRPPYSAIPAKRPTLRHSERASPFRHSGQAQRRPGIYAGQTTIKKNSRAMPGKIPAQGRDDGCGGPEDDRGEPEDGRGGPEDDRGEPG